MIDWSAVQYFKPGEFACHCGCGKAGIQPAIVYALDQLREDYGKPLVVTSGYRCPYWNSKKSTTGENGPHVTGLAVDLAVSGRDAWTILRMAMESRVFTGIGLNQKGSDRFIHLDMIPDSLTHKRPWVWTY